MNATFHIAGIAFSGAAIAGGVSKAFGFNFPPLTSIKRQVMLGAVGVGFLVAAVITGTAAYPALGYESLRGTTWRGTITVGLWRGAVGPPSDPLKMVFDNDGTVLVIENYHGPRQDIVTETAHCTLATLKDNILKLDCPYSTGDSGTVNAFVSPKIYTLTITGPLATGSMDETVPTYRGGPTVHESITLSKIS